MTIELVSTDHIQEGLFDAIVIISDGINSLARISNKFPDIYSVVEDFSKVFHSLDKGGVSLILAEKLPLKRIIYSSTGPVHGDFDDVRRYTKAGIAAGEKIISNGIRSPLLITLPSERFTNAQFVADLGVLHALHTPLIIRQESNGNDYVRKVDLLGILELDGNNSKTVQAGPKGIVELLGAVQTSFDVCRDIGDGDPQRMCPARVVEYIKETFKDSTIKIRVLDDPEVIKRDYPLMAAVTRCANAIEDHKARFIWLEYDGGAADPAETLFIVGKGVTIDTGGVDLKVNGAMWGMCKDKYGSAVLAGFFKALDLLKPAKIKVVGCMCMCRNSIGSNAYTCDEIITARSGKRVQIYNTDAEGRMAMADPLTEFREQAIKSKNPHLITIATLTGHAVLSYGHCAAVMDNGPARSVHYAQSLQATGHDFGQPLEVSTLFYEDFDFHSAESDKADLRQSNTKPSVQTLRGHQTPAAFLMRVSRLDENGLDSRHPLKYTHLDIGYSMDIYGAFPKASFPSPLLVLISKHILSQVQ